jgi:hypothetical protein
MDLYATLRRRCDECGHLPRVTLDGLTVVVLCKRCTTGPVFRGPWASVEWNAYQLLRAEGKGFRPRVAC